MNKTLKTALIVGGAVIGLLVLVPLIWGVVSGWGYAGWGYAGWGMMGPGMMDGFVGMGLMPLIWIIVLGLIIWVITAAVSGTAESRKSDCFADRALDILDRRYARGEISKEEYEYRTKDLD